MNFCNYYKNIILLFESKFLPLPTSVSEEYQMIKTGDYIWIRHGALEYYIPEKYVWYLEGSVKFLFNKSKLTIYWWRYGKEW